METNKRIKAKDLRDKEKLNQIPDKAGYYKWWAYREELDIILKALNVDFNGISNDLDKGNCNNMYAIYVGIAKNKSVRNRLNMHVNKSMKNSTLRRSISSIVAHKYDKDATNEFINKLYIEYTSVDEPIRSEQAKHKLEEIEKHLMHKKYYILNIKDNHYDNQNLKQAMGQLLKLRAESKANNK